MPSLACRRKPSRCRPPRGHGVTHWLPWLTVAQIEPLVRLRDVFGSFDIDDIEKLPLAERLRRSAAFSEHRSFGTPPAAQAGKDTP